MIELPCEQRLHFRGMSWCAKSSLCRQPFKSVQKSGRINKKTGFFLFLTGLEHCVSRVNEWTLTIIAPSCILSHQMLAYERGSTQLKRSNRKISKQFQKSRLCILKSVVNNFSGKSRKKAFSWTLIRPQGLQPGWFLHGGKLLLFWKETKAAKFLKNFQVQLAH